MILDAQNLFDDAAEHLTTEASDNIVDLGEDRDLGTGENLYLVAIVDVAFTDVGSDSTMTLEIEVDDNEGFSSPTVAQTIGTFAALSAVGSRLAVRLQPDVITERYMRVKYTVANGDLTAGSFTVGIVKDLQQFRAYQDAITIS